MSRLSATSNEAQIVGKATEATARPGMLRWLRDAADAGIQRMRRTEQPQQYAFHYERVLGTSFELQVIAADSAAATRAEEAALAEVDRLSGVLSSYSATSELSGWLSQPGVVMSVSPALGDVLLAAEAWRVRTGGAFNPAASSVIDLLRDADPVSLSVTALDAPARSRAMNVRLRAMRQPLWTVNRARGSACRLTDLPISLDAIAKGYIVDRVAHVAREVAGITQVLVNIGGDLRHHGARAVQVSVADPNAPAENAAPLSVVRLMGEALATSGGYRRGFAMDGQTVSHIIDPRTGRPVSRVVSASVVAPDCMTADALSTAFSVMTPGESVTLADAFDGVGCLLVEQDGTITSNDVWRERVAA
jgi:thiamine biosynthesis lipoprotein